LEVDSTLFVGREGHGLLRVEGTAEVVADAVYAGVEAGGSGVVEVEAGGRLLVESVLALASDAGSEATLLVTGEGSEVAVNFIGAIGGEGVATARVEQGGRLVFETADEAGFLLLGAAAE